MLVGEFIDTSHVLFVCLEDEYRYLLTQFLFHEKSSLLQKIFAWGGYVIVKVLNDRTAFFVGVREYFVLDNVDDRKKSPQRFFL